MGNNIPVPDKSVKKDYELEPYELESIDDTKKKGSKEAGSAAGKHSGTHWTMLKNC